MTRGRHDVLVAPVVVVGAPRSGTTFLAGLLGLLPEFGLAHEPRLVWRYGNDRRSDVLTAEHASPAVRRHIRSRLSAHVAGQDGRRLVEKTPSNSLRLPFVDAVLPDARYIHVLRDGHAAVASIIDRWRREGKRATGAVERDRLLERLREVTPRQASAYVGEALNRYLPTSRRAPPMWGPRLPGLAELVNDLGVVATAALQWRTCVEMAVAHGRGQLGGRYLEVRLEALDSDRMREVAVFAGVDEPARLVDTFEATYSLPERARSSLSAEERRTVAAWITSTQRMLGYE